MLSLTAERAGAARDATDFLVSPTRDKDVMHDDHDHDQGSHVTLHNKGVYVVDLVDWRSSSFELLSVLVL